MPAVGHLKGGFTGGMCHEERFKRLIGLLVPYP